MPRVEKGTRLRGLPPKIRLQELDCRSGSFPTVVRTVTDGRTGQYDVVFNDANTVDFTHYSGSTNANSIYYGTMLPSGSRFLTTELTTGLSGAGDVVRGIGDKWVSFTPGQNLGAFVDSGHPAVDGVVSTSVHVANTFYTTGTPVSVVGEGFQQPLTAKTKIVIPLVSSVQTSIGIENNQGKQLNFPMGYWNFNNGTIEGIGTGREFASYSLNNLSTVKQLLEEQLIATNYGVFSCSDGILASNPELVACGQQSSDFGFPFHGKFHATSSQLFKLTASMSEPFLVEKMVLELKLTLAFNDCSDWITAGVPSAAIMNFFLVNQRDVFSFSDPAYQTISFNLGGANLTFLSGANVTGSIRDVVCMASFTSFFEPTGSPDLTRFKNNEFGNVDGYTTSEVGYDFDSLPIVLSASVANPIQSEGQAALSVNDDGGSNVTLVVTKQVCSTRSALYSPTGRSWVSELPANTPRVTTRVHSTKFDTFDISQLSKKTNPYLLLPTDKLILAFHVPYDRVLNQNPDGVTYRIHGDGPSVQVEPFKGKLTLYGSHLRVGDDGNWTEYHDTLNQLLNSDAIHEAIGT